MCMCVCACVTVCAHVYACPTLPLVDGGLDALSLGAQPAAFCPPRLLKHLEANVLLRELVLGVVREVGGSVLPHCLDLLLELFKLIRRKKVTNEVLSFSFKCQLV